MPSLPIMDVDDELALAMVTLAEAFGAKLTEARIRLYADALRGLPLATVHHAMRLAVRECRFFPTAAELLAFARGSTDDRALLAWTAFAQAAARVGAWAPIEVEDGAAAEALLLVFGSWPAFCTCEMPALALRRVEFLAAYRAASRRADPAPQTRLLGLCEEGGAAVASGGASWCGRITAGGAVVVERDRTGLLPAVGRQRVEP